MGFTRLGSERVQPSRKTLVSVQNLPLGFPLRPSNSILRIRPKKINYHESIKRFDSKNFRRSVVYSRKSSGTALKKSHGRHDGTRQSGGCISSPEACGEGRVACPQTHTTVSSRMSGGGGSSTRSRGLQFSNKQTKRRERQVPRSQHPALTALGRVREWGERGVPVSFLAASFLYLVNTGNSRPFRGKSSASTVA